MFLKERAINVDPVNLRANPVCVRFLRKIDETVVFTFFHLTVNANI